MTALLLSPVATELPEIMNAVIWVRQGKTPLALANISGAMMIQAAVPSGLGLLFTPWKFDTALLVSGLVTIASISYLLVLLRTKRFNASLTAAVLFYVAFSVTLLTVLHGGSGDPSNSAPPGGTPAVTTTVVPDPRG